MFKKIILNTLKKYELISKNDYIIIGVSGGADSMSLLYFLKEISAEYNLKLRVVHINHGIRVLEGKKDEEFVKNFCKKIDVPFNCFYFNVKKEAKKLSLSEEEAGRVLRYKCFLEVLEKYNANKIAVAHNKNDNVETILLNLFRGSGLKGISGIPKKRDYIIRPLIECERKVIEDYCKKNSIEYKIDFTNRLSIYTRNKLRLDIIPLIEKLINSNIIETISKTGDIINEENLFLEKFSQKTLKKVATKLDEDIVKLDINLLKQEDIAIIKRVIRLSLINFEKNLKNISSKHISMVLDILNNQSGKFISLPNNIIVKKEYNNLIFSNKNLNNTLNFNYNLTLESPLFIPELNKYIILSKKMLNNLNYLTKVYTIMLDYAKIKGDLKFRTRCPGDKIYLKGINNYKKLKNLFIDLKIPYNERNSIPILADQDEVISIINFKISDNYKITEKTKNKVYLHIWEE